MFALTQSYWASVLGAAAPCAVGLLVAMAQSAPSKQLAPPPPIDFLFFSTRLLPRWVKAHGLPEKMLPDHPSPAPQSAVVRDVTQFSFDRLLVVDRAETAAMLIANNLHFETSMPIVSIDGYPHNVFRNVMDMVRRNPRLKVFALHDADPTGCTLPLRLREEPAWFPSPDVVVYDAGLRPRHIASMPGMILQRGTRTVELAPSLARNLSAGERRWLAAGYVAELATMKPSRLMKAIYGYVARAADEEQAMRDEAAADPRGFFQTNATGKQA